MGEDPVVLDEDALMVALQLQAVRNDINNLKAFEKELRTELLGIVGTSPLAVDADGREVVTITTSGRRTVNRARLEALFPDVFAQVIDESEVTTVKIVS